MLRLTLDLMRRRLAEIGAVEVVSGARHRDVAAKRWYTPSARGAGPVVGKAESVNRTGMLINSTYAPKPGARHCEEWRTFPPFLSLFFLRGTEEWRLVSTQRQMK